MNWCQEGMRMATVQIHSAIQLDIEQLLAGVAQLNTSELEQFLASVSLLLSNRKESTDLASEADLLQNINQGLPADTQQRYDALQSKLRSQSLTPEEHQDLLSLVDVVERSEAERLQHLITLSQMRKVSLDDLLKQLDIPQPPIHV
jgi:hypothetical protein